MSPIGLPQNQVNFLPNLARTRYENIFKVYKLLKDKDNSYYFYNILNKVMIPDSIDKNIYNTLTPAKNTAWTILSYRIYGTMDLWWLIYLINKPKNIFLAQASVAHKYIKPEYVDSILTDIEQQLNA